jgi:hypothetical protein
MVILDNILVLPTVEEMKNKVLLKSLPILIDFGYSRIGYDNLTTSFNIKDLIRLFSCCRYGTCRQENLDELCCQRRDRKI